MKLILVTHLVPFFTWISIVPTISFDIVDMTCSKVFCEVNNNSETDETLFEIDNHGDPFFLHLIFYFREIYFCNVMFFYLTNNITEKCFTKIEN